MLYNELTHEIIASDTHAITVRQCFIQIWSVCAIRTAGKVGIETRLKFKILSPLPESSWITGMTIREKVNHLYLTSGTGILVIDLKTGNLLEDSRCLTKRGITFVAHHEFYQYLLLGTIDGSIKIVNSSRDTVHEFLCHTNHVVSISCLSSGSLFISCGADQTIRLFNLKTFREIFRFLILT